MYSDFYEIPLPALRFEKTEEIDKKVRNDIEERNDAFQIDHIKKKRRQKLMTLIHSKETLNHLQKDDTQGTYDASRTTKRRQKKNVNKRFPERHPEQPRCPQDHRPHSKDLINHRSLNKRI